MKSAKEIFDWCEMMLSCHPNIEDQNYFKSIQALCQEKMAQEVVQESNMNSMSDLMVMALSGKLQPFDIENL